MTLALALYDDPINSRDAIEVIRYEMYRYFNSENNCVFEDAKIRVGTYCQYKSDGALVVFLPNSREVSYNSHWLSREKVEAFLNAENKTSETHISVYGDSDDEYDDLLPMGVALVCCTCACEELAKRYAVFH